MVSKALSTSLAVVLVSGLIFMSIPGTVFAKSLPGNDTFTSSDGGIKNPLGDKNQTITDVLVKVINWMLGLVGFIALIALITGGARMIMDFGNEEQVKKGKTTILWAVIGLLVVILSYAIINIVTGEILGGGSGGGSNSTTGTSQGTDLGGGDF